MNKTLLAIAALGTAAAVSAPASAATTFKIDTSKTSVSVKDSTFCLIGNCSLSASLASTMPKSFNLNVGQSTTFDFAKFVMGSGLGWGTATVNATLSFLTPGGSASSAGTDSYLDLGGLFTAQTNSFTWTNPVQTITANGANYTVSLTDVADCDGFLTRATVKLNSVGAVPEPATWGMMILGMGALGVAMRRQRKVTTRVSFA